MVNVKFLVRFWGKVEISGENECWNWKAGLSAKGYGLICLNGKIKLAHRISYMLTKGEIAEGLVIMHTCDNRMCVNPSHLRIGTIAENNRDMVEKGRQAIGEKNGRSKLTPLKVANLRSKHKKGNYSYRELGKMFGISPGTVVDIVKGDLWKSQLAE